MKTIETDVCIVGSGAAGSVLAHRMALLGRRVLVIERGRYYTSKDMNDDELEMYGRLYKDGGTQMTTSLDLFLLQGQCVGGTTVLTNGVCFRTPDHVLSQWENHGFQFDRKKLNDSFARIEEDIQVTPMNKAVCNGVADKFSEGAQALGLEVGQFNKNITHCTGCGYCNMGCRYDRKQSALVTFIPWAEALGAEILAETEVLRIVYRNGHVASLWAKRTMPDGRYERLQIQAKQYIISGGAINSSGLLLRSGITSHIGTGLSFNVGTIVNAEFDDVVDGHIGDQMCAFVKEDDFTIETIFNPPVAFSLTMPCWFTQHRRAMEQYRHFAAAGVLVGTESNARVVYSWPFGHEVVRYKMTTRDLEKLKRGIQTTAAAFLEAGARSVLPATHRYMALTNIRDLDQINDAIQSMGDVSMGSSHPQGGNCIGGDAESSAVSSEFNVWGFDNLFVCDASVFPSTVFVNPQLSIMALADYAAEIIFRQN